VGNALAVSKGSMGTGTDVGQGVVIVIGIMVNNGIVWILLWNSGRNSHRVVTVVENCAFCAMKVGF